MKRSKGGGAAAAGREPVEHWDKLLRPVLKKSPDFAKNFLAGLREARLIFGDRVHCPFLRPFFLSPSDEQRVRRAAETIAGVAERVARAALEDKSLFRQFHLRPEEERLVRMTRAHSMGRDATLL